MTISARLPDSGSAGQVTAAETAKRKVARLAAWSIAIALLVLGLKAFAWYVTGSAALYSDAAESIVNVIAAAVAWWAIQVSHRPADREHQHGHHKAEYFSAVLEGVFIIVAALLILVQVWRVLQDPQPLSQPWTGFAVNGAASAINALWAALLILVRDLAILVAGIVLLVRRRARIEVRYIGKVATFSLMTSIGCIAWGNLGYVLSEAALVCGWAFFAAGIVEYYVATLLYIGDLRRAWRVPPDRASERTA